MLKPIVWDCETFYDADFSLTKLTTEEYVRDPRFKVHLWAYKTEGSPAGFQYGPHLDAMMKAQDWSKIACIAHNAAFDGFVMSQIHDVKPAFWFDTLSMARLLFPHEKRHSLAALNQRFGLSEKPNKYDQMKGRRDPSDQEMQVFGVQGLGDVEATWDLWKMMIKLVPKEELRLIDLTIRLMTEPVVRLDTDLLAAHHREIVENKDRLLQEIGATRETLHSAESYAQLLRSLGIEPPTKTSPATGKETYAFSKTDHAHVELLDHADARVQAAVACRLGIKSTGDETRCERLFHTGKRGLAPVPLKYCGAHTTRWSGDGKVNWQNFRRGSAIRRSVLAPPGYVIVVGDLSQIECRMLNWLAGEESVLDAFREGRDLYCEGASRYYGRTITKVDKAERFLFKTAELGCFGPETIVLTKYAMKPITEVTKDDWLWDGQEWVQHSGLVYRGKKNLLQMLGVWVTPEHPILCGKKWKPASKVDRNVFAQCRASATFSESFPLLATKSGQEAGSDQYWYSADAGRLNIGSMHITSRLDAAKVVIAARKKRLLDILENGLGIKTSYQMIYTGKDFLIEYPRSVLDVIPNVAIKTTGLGASRFMIFGKKIARYFYLILSLWKVGIIQNWILIGSTIRWGIYQAICDFQLVRPTIRTSGLWRKWKKNSDCYDIAFSGPRNRYTIVTYAGPIIVHNCGYGMGPVKFRTTVNAAAKSQKLKEIEDYEAEATVKAYRNSHMRVCSLWRSAGHTYLPYLVQRAGCNWGPMELRGGYVYLPNGAPLDYTTVRVEGRDYTQERKNGPHRIYGPLLVENVVQALSRVVLAQAALKINPHYRIITLTHDEVVCLAPEREADDALKFVLDTLRETPSWAPGIPLDAEGSYGERYDK